MPEPRDPNYGVSVTPPPKPTNPNYGVGVVSPPRRPAPPPRNPGYGGVVAPPGQGTTPGGYMGQPPRPAPYKQPVGGSSVYTPPGGGQFQQGPGTTPALPGHGYGGYLKPPAGTMPSPGVMPGKPPAGGQWGGAPSPAPAGTFESGPPPPGVHPESWKNPIFRAIWQRNQQGKMPGTVRPQPGQMAPPQNYGPGSFQPNRFAPPPQQAGGVGFPNWGQMPQMNNFQAPAAQQQPNWQQMLQAMQQGNRFNPQSGGGGLLGGLPGMGW